VATPALVVFAKVPIAGEVKTRLTPPLTPTDAAHLYEAFLHDALEDWAGGGGFGLPEPPVVRLYVARDAGSEPSITAPAGVSVHVQRGPDLGARMLRATVESFAAGHDRVVLIGSDHPTLPGAFVGEAFRALLEPLTVVLGPSEDGGYYLIGLNEVLPDLFDGLEYSHAGVLGEALARAADAGVRPVLLPEWYDVDTPDALARLVADRAAGVHVGARTAEALDALADTWPV
jgi:uncharacterized protein